jgi:hypothetical protein
MMTEVYHDHEADALPQASQPFGDYVASRQFYRSSMGKVLVHTEKRGPAFDAAAATARLITAMTNGVFIDVVPAWTDLITALHVAPALARGPVFWIDMKDAIYRALEGANGPDRDALWGKADAAVRGYALVAAETWAKDAERTQGGDDWADVDMDRRNEIVASYASASKLRAFAAGVR